MDEADSLRAALEGSPRRAGFVIAGVLLGAVAVVGGLVFRPSADPPRGTPKLTSAPVPVTPIARDPIPELEPPPTPASVASALDSRSPPAPPR